jgi:hypothetical protein
VSVLHVPQRSSPPPAATTSLAQPDRCRRGNRIVGAFRNRRLSGAGDFAYYVALSFAGERRRGSGPALWIMGVASVSIRRSGRCSRRSRTARNKH